MEKNGYDLSADPHEIINLAGDEKYAERLEEMRKILEHWIVETSDKGMLPESQTMYVSDMKVYVDNIKRNNPEEATKIERNIATMKRWAEQGK